jgi:hypothetical protein
VDESVRTCAVMQEGLNSGHPVPHPGRMRCAATHMEQVEGRRRPVGATRAESLVLLRVRTDVLCHQQFGGLKISDSHETAGDTTVGCDRGGVQLPDLNTPGGHTTSTATPAERAAATVSAVPRCGLSPDPPINCRSRAWT